LLVFKGKGYSKAHKYGNENGAAVCCNAYRNNRNNGAGKKFTFHIFIL